MPNCFHRVVKKTPVWKEDCYRWFWWKFQSQRHYRTNSDGIDTLLDNRVKILLVMKWQSNVPSLYSCHGDWWKDRFKSNDLRYLWRKFLKRKLFSLGFWYSCGSQGDLQWDTGEKENRVERCIAWLEKEQRTCGELPRHHDKMVLVSWSAF